MLLGDTLVDTFDIIADFTDQEFVEWVEAGAEILPPFQLLLCFKLLLSDLEKHERYEWCTITMKHIKLLDNYCNQKHL
jgi:hypothetical protein